MNLSKLKIQYIAIIGAVLWILVGGGITYFLVKPSRETFQAETTRVETLTPLASLSARGAAERDLEAAKQEVAKAEQDFNIWMDKKMPNLRFDQREKGMLQLWHEQVEVLGPLLEKWARKYDVQITSNIEIPSPPVNPNDPLFSQEFFSLPIGEIAVRGKFKDILEHIRSWNKCNRLVQIDLPTLDGPSPTLTSSYKLTVFIFPRKTAKDAPNVIMAGGSSDMGSPGGAPPPPPPPPSTGGGQTGP